MALDRRSFLRAFGLFGAALATGALATAARAAASDDEDDEASPAAAAHFPQPVRVGLLIGRDVLQSTESQPVLGHVRALVRGPDNALSLVMNAGGWFGWGGRPVAVPLQAVSLLGEYLVLTGLGADRLGRLPTYDGRGTPLPSGEIVEVGLTKPAH